jgi:hypothetical protein
MNLRGLPREEVWKAQLAAASEYFFLYSLIGRVNEHASHNWEAWTLRALLTATQSLQSDMMWLLVPDSPKDPGYEQSLDRVRTESQHSLVVFENSKSVYAGTIQAIERVSQTYAAGTPILFRGARKELEFGLTCLKLLEDACRANRIITSSDPPAEVQAVAEGLARLWVEQARIDLHDVRSERDEVMRILERQLERIRPGASQRAPGAALLARAHQN